MIFNYVDPYQSHTFNNSPFLESSLTVTPTSSPIGFHHASPSSIDLLAGAPYAESNVTNNMADLKSPMIVHDPLGRFLNAKKESLTEVANGTLEQISERLAIRDSNFYEIDQRISRANCILDNLSMFYLGASMVVDKRKATIEKELMSFEQERRFEAVSCWRDISRLRLQLGEIGQLLDNHASRELLIEG